MTTRKALAVISEVFNISYTEIAEKIGRSKQEVSMWASGKRNIPKKWLKEIMNIEEFKVFEEFPDDFLNRDLSHIDELDVQVAYYFYLAEKDGVAEDYSHPYFEKINQLQEEMDKLGILEDVKDLIDDPQFADYPDYLELLKRVNLLIRLKKEGRTDALVSMVKVLTEDIFNSNFDIKEEDEFTQELYKILAKYELLEEVPVIRHKSEAE